MLHRVLYILIATLSSAFAVIWAYVQWLTVDASQNYTPGYTVGKPGWFQLIGILVPLAVAVICSVLAARTYHVYQGKVIGRKHVPAHDETGTTVSTGINFSGIGTSLGGGVYLGPVVGKGDTQRVDDIYQLRLCTPDGCTGQWITVSQEVYDQSPEGSAVDLRDQQ